MSRWKVLRSIPALFAADEMFPRAARAVAQIRGLERLASIAPWPPSGEGRLGVRRAGGGGAPAGAAAGSPRRLREHVIGEIAHPDRQASVRAQARSMTFCSSRTFPGHGYASSAAIAASSRVSARPPPYFFEEGVGEELDVAGAIPERRQLDGNDVDPVVELLAERL